MVSPNQDMKTLSLFFCLLIAVSARAANPALSDFNKNQFGTNAGSAFAGNGVRIVDGVIVSNLTSWKTMVVTNVGAGGGVTLSNSSISYRDGSGNLGDFV